MSKELRTVPLSSIFEGDRARKDYGKTEMTELIESIKTNGLMQPITVMEGGPEGFEYTLLAGGRRFRAHNMIEAKTIFVRVYPEMTVLDQKIVELGENIYRKDLEWQEQVTLTKQIDEYLTQIKGGKAGAGDRTDKTDLHTTQGTAEFIGRSHSQVSSDLRLAEAIEVMPELKKAKTKKEARKMIETAARDITTQDHVEKIMKTPIAEVSQKLIESYHLIPSMKEEPTLEDGFFAGVKHIQDGTIDFCEIDPPYAIDLNNIKRSDDNTKIRVSGYNEVSPDQYVDFMTKTAIECYRVMKEDGWVVCWLASQWLETLYQIFTSVGFTGKVYPAMWAKTNGQTQQPYYYLASHYEMFIYLRKGNAKINRPGRGNIFNFPAVVSQDKIHPTERPIEMIEEIMRTFIGQQRSKNILVPFAGSGNSLFAAANLGHNVVGFDMTEKYYNEFVLRANEGTIPFTSYKLNS